MTARPTRGDRRWVAIATSAAFGPQYDGDNAFTRRIRFHQSWYRAEVLRVPCGTGPTAARSDRDKKGRTAVEQAAEYVAQLTTHAAECLPFFQRLASALARIYGRASELRVDRTLPPRWEVWWPGGSVIGPG